MKIAFFFRKASPVFHSIEEQFFAMQNHLPEDVKSLNRFAKFQSKGILRRLFITIQAAFNQGDINHITGDIHFVALFLRKRKTILTVHDIGSVLGTKGNSKAVKKILFRLPTSDFPQRNRILRFFWFTMPFARVRYITVISEFTKQEILQNFKIKEEKIIVIPDCVSDKIHYSPKIFNSEKPVILQIGTKSNKNLDNLIPALTGINCKLIIVGKLASEQLDLLSLNNIDFETNFNLDYHEIIDLYKNAELITFVSTYEGFGVPILEAQASGRAVITSNLSPMKEVADEGALLVDPYNIEEIREAVKRMIHDTELRQKLIKQGLENVKKYSAKAVALKYYELYNNLTSERGND